MIYRAWLEVVCGGDRVVVPAFAKPGTVTRTGDRLSLELNPCPERDAVLKGKQFSVEAANFVGLFTAIATGEELTLAPQGQGYSLDESDLTTATFSAWATDPRSFKSASEKPAERSIAALPIEVRVAPGGSTPVIPARGLVLRAGARCTLSPDLVGQRISLQVQYPRAVVLQAEPIALAYAHLVEAEGADLWYRCWQCTDLKSQDRAVSFAVSPLLCECPFVPNGNG